MESKAFRGLSPAKNNQRVRRQAKVFNNLALMLLAGSVALISTIAIVPAGTNRIAANPPMAAPSVAATSAQKRGETIRIYFTPLASTEVARDVGLGEAYHMALVYTDAAGTSFGVSGGPSDLATAQTPANAADAILAMAEGQPSRFGTLVSDPSNDTAFLKKSAADFYTQSVTRQAYPHSLVARGTDLSAQWRQIVRTYALIGRLNLTYSPIMQNSNSMAVTAIEHAGLRFRHSKIFVPGAYTSLPIPK